MISRYAPKGRSQGSSLTYYVLGPDFCDKLDYYLAYDSATSALIATSETLEELAAKMLFLGYTLQKEIK